MQNFCFFPLRNETKVSLRYLQLQFHITKAVAIEERESSEAAPGAIHLCFPHVVTGEKNGPTAAHEGGKRRPNWYPVPRVKLSHPATGVINTVNWNSCLGIGRQANNLSP
jgi:hypothetical protein